MRLGKETKTEIVKIRMTAAEKEDLRILAAQKGMTVSCYIRTVSARPPDVTRADLDHEISRLRYEINKIGVNINQVAKKYNENLYIKPSDELLSKLDEVENMLMAVCRVCQGGRAECH